MPTSANQGVRLPARTGAVQPDVDLANAVVDLEQRSVMRFASDADRSTRLVGVALQPGMVSYLADVDRHDRYVAGSGWQPFSRMIHEEWTGQVAAANGQRWGLSTLTRDVSRQVGLTGRVTQQNLDRLTITAGAGGPEAWLAEAYVFSDRAMTARSVVDIDRGSEIAYGRGQLTVGEQYATASASVVIPAGGTQTLIFAVTQTSGGIANVSCRIRLTRLG